MQADYYESWPPHPALLQVILNRTRERRSRFARTMTPDPVPTAGQDHHARPASDTIGDGLTHEPLWTLPLPADGATALRIAIDERARTCHADGSLLALTRTAFDLLAYFAHHAGACCDRQELLDAVWGEAYVPTSNVVDYTVAKIRQALAPFGLQGCIVTVRGSGYRYDAPEGAARVGAC